MPRSPPRTRPTRRKRTMVTPESKLKKDIKVYLNSRSIYWAIVPEGSYGKSGDPDLIACYKGMFVGLEAKTYEGRQSGIQKVRQREIEASGGVYAIVRSVRDVEEALDMAEHRYKQRRMMEREARKAEEQAKAADLEDPRARPRRHRGRDPDRRRRGAGPLHQDPRGARLRRPRPRQGGRRGRHRHGAQGDARPRLDQAPTGKPIISCFSDGQP